MAELKNTNIAGTLSNIEGSIEFNTMPIVNGKVLIERQSIDNFFAWGTCYRVDPNTTRATSSVFSQNPLSTSPVIVPMSNQIPSEMQGDVAGVEAHIEFLRNNSSGMIFMVKPKGEAGSGNGEWVNHGYLYSAQISRIKKNFTIATDLNGDFEIWAYSGGWQPRIARILLRAVYLKA